MLPSTDQREIIMIPLDVNLESANFAVRVVGNDMEPLLYEGDFLLVKAQTSIKHGELGVFMVNGKMHVKRMYFKGGHCRLISLNIDYEDIVIDSINDLNCQGKVIRVLHPDEFTFTEA